MRNEEEVKMEEKAEMRVKTTFNQMRIIGDLMEGGSHKQVLRNI